MKSIKRIITLGFILFVAFVGFLGAYISLSLHLSRFIDFTEFGVSMLASFFIMVFSLRKFFKVLDTPDETEEPKCETARDLLFKEEVKKEPSGLYYEIMEAETSKGLRFKFRIRSRNHETICVSDWYNTRSGAETGVFYLVQKILEDERIDQWS